MYFVFLYNVSKYQTTLKPDKYQAPIMIGFWPDIEQAIRDVKEPFHYDHGWLDRAFILYHEPGNYLRSIHDNGPKKMSRIEKCFELVKEGEDWVVHELKETPQEVLDHGKNSGFLY